MEDRRIDMEAGLEGMHQVSLRRSRLSPTAASYSAMPSAVQTILTLSLGILGAGGRISAGACLVEEMVNLEIIMS